MTNKELQRIKASAISGQKWDCKVKQANAMFEHIAEEKSLETVAEIKANQPEWTEFEGVVVLRVRDSSFVAVPVSGRKNSKQFHVIDLNDRSDFVCQLTNKEVIGWLAKKEII